MLLETGTLDEWLSQWSAKPCTAVRIRQVPQKEFQLLKLFFLFPAVQPYQYKLAWYAEAYLFPGSSHSGGGDYCRT